MAAPSFVQASTGATDASGTFTFTGVATGTVDNLVILQILNDGTGVISWGTLSGTNIQNLAGTANVWTDVGIFFAGAAAQQRIFIGRRTSASSAPTFTASANTSGDDVYGRMYEFTNVSAGTTLATVIENSTAGGTSTSGVTSSNTASNAAVTTLGPDRLALNFVGVNDDNAIATLASAGLQAWGLAIAPYADAGGTDGAIGLQTAWPGSICAGLGTSMQGFGSTVVEAVSQQFTTSGALDVAYVTLALSKSATPPADNVVVEIQTDSAGLPSGSVVGSGGTIAASSLSDGAGGTRVFSTRVAVSASLSAATTYHLVARRSGAPDASSFYYIGRSGADALTATDWGYESYVSGTWTNQSVNDVSFALHTATEVSSGATIDGATGSIVDIDSWGVVGFALIGTTVVLDQQHFRFRNDDGNETTATWLADLDTNVS